MANVCRFTDFYAYTRFLRLFFFKLTDCFCKLIGTWSSFHSALYSRKAFYSFICVHSDDKAWNSLCISVTAAVEFYAFYFSVLYFKVYCARTGSFCSIMKFRHGKIPLFLFFLYLYFYLLLADFLLFWAKTGYLLPCAALYTHFSESKEWSKDFRGSIAAAKAWLSIHTSNYRRQSSCMPPKFSIFARRCSALLDMGFCTRSNPIRHKCYFLYTQTVNRTYFSAQLAYGKMTFTNVSFMFGGINVQVCSKPC